MKPSPLDLSTVQPTTCIDHLVRAIMQHHDICRMVDQSQVSLTDVTVTNVINGSYRCEWIVIDLTGQDHGTVYSLITWHTRKGATVDKPHRREHVLRRYNLTKISSHAGWTVESETYNL